MAGLSGCVVRRRGGIRGELVKVALQGNEARNVRVALVSGNYFRVIGAGIAVGRDLPDATNLTANRDAVAVISDAFWKRWFGRTPDVLTKRIELNGLSYEVIGVATAPFTGHLVGHPIDLWVPLTMAPALVQDLPGLLEDRWGTGASWLQIVGRLREGVGLDEARKSADLIYKRFVAEQAAAIGGTSAAARRAARQTITLRGAAAGFAPERARFAWPVLMLSAFTGLVLLVACANFTNLMFARSATRQREFKIRHALGASRSRLIRQSMTECVALALVAGVLGWLVALWATAGLVHQFAITISPVEFDLRTDARVLLFTSMCVTVAVAFGLWPCARAVRWAGSAPVSELPHLAAGAVPRLAIGGSLMLIGQLTLCTVLLIGAGLLLRTVRNLRYQDFGFDRHVLLVSVAPNQTGYSEPETALLLRQARERLLAVPGVEAVGVSGAALLESSNYWIGGSQELTTDSGYRPGRDALDICRRRAGLLRSRGDVAGERPWLPGI